MFNDVRFKPRPLYFTNLRCFAWYKIGDVDKRRIGVDGASCSSRRTPTNVRGARRIKAPVNRGDIRNIETKKENCSF